MAVVWAHVLVEAQARARRCIHIQRHCGELVGAILEVRGVSLRPSKSESAVSQRPECAEQLMSALRSCVARSDAGSFKFLQMETQVVSPSDPVYWPLPFNTGNCHLPLSSHYPVLTQQTKRLQRFPTLAQAHREESLSVVRSLSANICICGGCYAHGEQTRAISGLPTAPYHSHHPCTLRKHQMSVHAQQAIETNSKVTYTATHCPSSPQNHWFGRNIC
jgi:hypothetical protein